MRVLVAPDKFKGSLTAAAAARAIARGWRAERPADRLTLQPIADGGDGFGAVLAGAGGAQWIRTRTVDAAHRQLRAGWWWRAHTRTAWIESARVVGLARLPAARRRPLELDTRGLAALLRAAARRGAQECFIGLGGSATNDGGFGLALALGWQFLDENARPLRQWTQLHRLARIVPPAQRTWPQPLRVAVDVRNPLLGAAGCTRCYGPQKGLRAAEGKLAERNLRRLARIVRMQWGRDLAALPGAGAAGGLGFGLVAFAGATLEPGFALVARELRLARSVAEADVVITGEGRLDASSFMGKGVGELAKLCATSGVPCVALAGEIAPRVPTRRQFAWTGALTALADAATAQRNAARLLTRLARRAAREMAST